MNESVSWYVDKATKEELAETGMNVLSRVERMDGESKRVDEDVGLEVSANESEKRVHANSATAA